jgi:hypothetical protein
MSKRVEKRKVNKSLKAWVTFVKKVQKEEKLNYKDALHRAKLRKDKGEKWMTGGESKENKNIYEVSERFDDNLNNPMGEEKVVEEFNSPDKMEEETVEEMEDQIPNENSMMGGKKKRRTMRKLNKGGRRKTARSVKRGVSRRH